MTTHSIVTIVETTKLGHKFLKYDNNKIISTVNKGWSLTLAAASFNGAGIIIII